MTVKSLLIFPVIFMLVFLSGCGVRSKKLLNRLSIGMSKDCVKKNIGIPDLIRCPIIKTNGDVIDIWEYSLAEVDKSAQERRWVMQIVGWLVFWPLLLFPSAWESSYVYDTYLIKFVNNLLTQWGTVSEVTLL